MKILILSASPQRDKYIDELFRLKLVALGHDVWVRPCLREGRKAVLDLQPDVCVIPPIRNPYSRDFSKTLKDFNIGVVTRHTEPSCDMKDFKAMTPRAQSEIYGRFPYGVDVELVWGPDEAILLNKRGVPFQAISMGTFISSTYASEEIRSQLMSKEVFKAKYDFKKETTILLSSPWGFVDTCPDLNTDLIENARNDIEGRDAYIKMIQEVIKINNGKHNLLLTLHPGVDASGYKDIGIPVDTDTPAMDLLVNSDMLIHSGSTMAIEMHIQDKPSFQYADVNAKNWNESPWCVVSKVSPRFIEVKEIKKHIVRPPKTSNANKEALKELELGRYGSMDGLAVDRAVEEIVKIEGQFKYCWPKSTSNYNQLIIKKKREDLVLDAHCGICGEEFFILNPRWLSDELVQRTGATSEEVSPAFGTCCPHCASRFFAREK